MMQKSNTFADFSFVSQGNRTKLIFQEVVPLPAMEEENSSHYFAGIDLPVEDR